MAAAVTSLSIGDVDAALGIVGQAAAVRGDTPFDLELLERMSGVLHAHQAGYVEHGGTGDGDILVVLHQREPGVSSEEMWAANRTWPLRDWANEGATVARCLTDWFPTRQRKLRNAWYRTVLHPCGTEDVIKVWLPSPAGIWRGFYFNREAGRPAFDERDRAVLTVLRPHLADVRERWHRQRSRTSGLTSRELEVLALLRDGLTNQEIAERLVLSAGTVRKHIENTFSKLDVHTRTAAVARAFGPSA